MAKDNVVLFSVGFDNAKVDKELDKFSKRFAREIKDKLKGIDLTKNLGLDKKLTLDFKFNRAATKREFDAMVSKLNFKVPLNLDLAPAKAQIIAFQAGLKPLTVPVTAVAAPAAPATPPGAPGTTAPTLNPASVTLNKGQIDAATASLNALQAELSEVGLTQTEVGKRTSDLTGKLRNVAKVLSDIQREREALQAATGSATLPAFSDNQILRLNKAQVALKDFNHEVTSFSKSSAIMRTDVENTGKFMESFGFKIGILGFSMSIFGGQLSRLSQFMTDFIQNTAKATEPLQRMTNQIDQLIKDGTIDPDKRGFILSELNRIADLPGANLENTVKSFRQLNAVGLEFADTLKLIEGLTKATAISGVGAEGLGQLGEQLRQFADEGKLIDKDVRSILRAGGSPVKKALEDAFGDTSAETLNAAGFKEVVRAISVGLKKLPEPLETTSDKLNKINNAFIRIQANIGKIIGPGLDNLLKNMGKLEDFVTRVAIAFDKLPDSTKIFISDLIIGIPVIAAGLATILASLGTVAIALAGGKQIVDSYRVAMQFLAKSAGVASTEFSLMGAILTKLKAPFVFILDFFKTIRAIGIVPVLKSATFGFSGLAGGLAKVLGLTSPLGIALNVLLGYLTNAGGSRDNINSAVLQLWESLKKLGATLAEFANGALGKAIIATLSKLVDIISGALANAFAGLILALSKAVDLLQTFMALVNSPSDTAAWANFGKALFEASVGWMARLGTLIGAGFLEAIADGLEGWFPNFAKAAREQATKSRANANDPTTWGGLTDSNKQLTEANKQLDDANAKALELDESFKRVAKVTKDIGESFNDLAFKIAQSNKALAFAQNKFNTEQANTRITDRISKLVQSDPNKALQEIPGAFNKTVANSNKIAASETSDAVKALGLEISRTQTAIANLFNTTNSIFGKTPQGQEVLNGLSATFRSLGQDFQAFVDSGSTNLPAFEKILNKYKEAGKALSDNALPKGESGEKQIKAFEQAFKDAADPLTKVITAIQELRLRQQQTANEAKKIAEDQAQDAKDRVKQIDNINNSSAARLELDKLTVEQMKDVRLAEKLRGAEQLKVQDQIDKRQNRIIALEKQIQGVNKVTTDAVAEAQKTQEEASESRRFAGQRELDQITLRIEANNQLLESFRQGFSDLDTFKEKLQDINTARAELGLGGDNASFNIAGGVTKQLQTSINDIVRENQAFGSDTFQLPQSEAFLENITRSLADGLELSKELQNRLLAIASGAGSSVVDLTTRILANERSIEDARKEVINSTGDNKKAAEAKLEDLLKIQTQLGFEVNVYLNRVKAVNTILEANTKVVQDQLKGQRDANTAQKEQLTILRERLQLEGELINARVSNADKAAQQPGNLGAQFNLNNIDELATIAAQTQAEIIQNRLKLQQNEINLKKLEIDEQLKLNKINQAEHDKRVADLEERRFLLGQIADQEIKGVNFDAAQASADRFRGTIEGLTGLAVDNIFKNFSDALQRASDDIPNNFDTISASMQLFQDVGVAAFAGAMEGIGDSLIKLLEGGDVGSLGEFLGSMLMMIGEQLIQMSLAMVAFAAISAFYEAGGGFQGLIAGALAAAAAAPFAAIGVAAGAALILAGGAMGGKGKHSPSDTSSKNVGNGTDAKAGAKTDDNWDPNKDPRTIFQKAMLTQIMIDVRTDDAAIVKTVIKHVNQNGRLTTLIGNRKLKFGY